MIQLYHHVMSVCAAKVRTVLAEKRLAWRGHHLNLRAGEALRPDYLKLNPAGVVLAFDSSSPRSWSCPHSAGALEEALSSCTSRAPMPCSVT